jgi:transitional endoplasmic reticulum ATPase
MAACSKCGELKVLVLEGSVCAGCSDALDKQWSAVTTRDWVLTITNPRGAVLRHGYRNTGYVEMKSRWATGPKLSDFRPATKEEVAGREYFMREFVRGGLLKATVSHFDDLMARTHGVMWGMQIHEGTSRLWEEFGFDPEGGLLDRGDDDRARRRRVQANEEILRWLQQLGVLAELYQGLPEPHEAAVEEIKKRLEIVGLRLPADWEAYQVLTLLARVTHTAGVESALEAKRGPTAEEQAIVKLMGRWSLTGDLAWQRWCRERALGTPPAETTARASAKEITDLHRLRDAKRGLSQVAGMADLKEQLTREVIGPFRDPELHRRYRVALPNGILFFGPPGCGKTYIARALAEELGWHFQYCRPSDVASPYIHDTVSKIRAIFSTAIQKAPAIVFIDEFEAFVPARSGLGAHQQYKAEEVNEFLANLEGCAERNVLVIAATNEPERIDQAVRRSGRFDKLIFIPPPDAEARRAMLEFHLQDRPVDVSLDAAGVAVVLEGYSASDIKLLVDEAARMALKRTQLITANTLLATFERVPASITVDDIRRYSAFRARGS